MRKLPARLWRIYRHDLPRVIRDLRWLILAVALLQIAGAWLGYRAAMQASFDAMMQNPDGTPPFGTVRFVLPFVPNFRAQIPAWYGYAGTNSLLAIWGWCYAVISGGAYAVYSALYNGWHLAWLVGGGVPLARATCGLGPSGTAAAMFLPHGVIELPAFLFARALALRAGLAWFWRVSGYGRWGSVKYQGREFRRMLAVIVPLLLVAGLLEAYPARYMRDRYLLGVGLSRELLSERRVLHSRELTDDLMDFAVSPDGKAIAIFESRRLRVLRKHAPDSGPLLELPKGRISSPSWSPDAKQIAVVRSPTLTQGREEVASQLFIVDGDSGEKRTVKQNADRRFYSPSWSPVGDEIVVRGVSPVPDTSGKRASDLWAVGVKSEKWRQITHLPALTSATGNACAAWSPDGRQLAFTRKGEKKDTYSVWVVGVNGSGLRQLTRGPRDASPSWSPDGKWIAFITRPPWDIESLFPDRYADLTLGVGYLAVIRADGTGRTDAIAKVDDLSHLAWARDGKSLYYTRMLTLMEGSPRVLEPR